MLEKIELGDYNSIVEEIYRIDKLTDEEVLEYETVECFRQFLLIALNAKRSGKSVEDVMRCITGLYIDKHCLPIQ
jgi:hypothetical protein